MNALFVGAFLLSGAAGLFYELLWTRYLALFVGHAAYAQVLVIAVFLGGLALGSFIIGDRSRRISNPLRGYVLAEVTLALAGLLFHPVYTTVTAWAYGSLYPSLGPGPGLTVAKWTIATLLILPQAVVLGMTFPLMAAALLRRTSQQGGRIVSVLYAANSFGGAVGIMLAGFLALGLVGLPGSLRVAAGLNLLAALLAWWAVQGAREVVEPAAGGATSVTGEEAREEESPPASPVLWRTLLLISATSAFASFIYEIGWIRMLALVMGSATHTFEIMLSAFVLGLALGALLIRDAAQSSRTPIALLAGVQWFMGLAAIATIPVYAMSFPVMGALIDALPASVGAYSAFNVVRYGLALSVMLPATVLAGMTLPLITSLLLRNGNGERSVGWVYGVNTMGSVLGVITGGLLLLPVLGLKGILFLGAVIDMGLGVYLWRNRSALGESTPLRARRGLVWGVTVVVLLVALLVPFDRSVVTGGVFRYGARGLTQQSDIVFYQDGRTATVSVAITPASKLVVLSTNGKPDASLSFRFLQAARGEGDLSREPITQQDESTQIFAGTYALAHHPMARTVAVVGHGSGMTSQMLLGSPHLESLVTIEIEPEMIEGSKLYYPANERVFDDSRSRFAIADAKTFFSERDIRYDLIVSEPSNPWVSGVSALFTTEFYGRMIRHLEPDGLFVQWIHLYEIEDGLVESVMAAIHQNFSDYHGYLISASDLLIIAAPEGRVPEADWSVMQWPRIAADLGHITRFETGALESTWMFDKELLESLLETVTPNSDFRPVLEMRAERARFLRHSADGFLGLGNGRVRLGWVFSDRTVEFPDVPGVSPVSGLFTMGTWARSSWYQWAVGRRLSPGDAPDQEAADRLARQRLFRLQLVGTLSPDNWRAWTSRFEVIEGELHAGLPGQFDASLFEDARGFMDRYGAPPATRLAVQFLEGIARSRAELTAAAADSLVVSGAAGAWWLDPETLLDGGVAAYLALDRPRDARRVLELVAPVTSRSGEDLRTRLLRARINARIRE